MFRVGGSLAARVWDFNEGPPNEGPSGPNPSAGSATPAACWALPQPRQRRAEPEKGFRAAFFISHKGITGTKK